MNPSDPLYGPVVVIAAIVIACGLAALGICIERIGAWRRRRKRLKLLRTPQPYDALFVNSVAARDWKDVERAAKILRDAA